VAKKRGAATIKIELIKIAYDDYKATKKYRVCK